MASEKDDIAARPANNLAPIDLAAEPDFHLGDLVVRPSIRSVLIDGKEERIEPRVMQVLVALAGAGGETVSRDALVSRCWSGVTVGDDAIARAIAKVRKLGGFGGGAHFVVDTVPRVGFRLQRQLGAAPLPRTEASQPGAVRAPDAPQTRFMLLAAAAAIAAVIVGLGVFLVLKREPAEHGAGRVLVTPFTATDADPVSERVARNLTAAALRRMEGFAIADHTINEPSPRADFKVNGAVTRGNDEVIVSAQIFDSMTGLVLWSGKFEQPLDRVNGVEEQVAITLSATLRCALDEWARNDGAMPPSALSLVLQTCEGLVLQTRDALEPARELKRAYPNLTGANTLLALAAATSTFQIEHSTSQLAELRELTRRAASDALKEDPSDAKAITSLAFIADTRLEREQKLREALRINPDLPPALANYIGLLRDVGRVKEAQELGARAIRMSDPRLNSSTPHVVFLSAILNDEESENEAIRKYDEIYPGAAEKLRWTVAVWWRDPALAVVQLPRLAESLQDKSGVACFEIVLAKLAADEQLNALPTECEGLPNHWKVRLLARIGDVDRAYELFLSPENRPVYPMILFYPEMRSFRRDARFPAVVKDLGLIDYWRQSGNSPDFCNEPDLPYDCARM